LVPTTSALPAPELHQFIGAPVPAARTHEAIRPAASGQILLACFLSGKLRLKLGQSLRKWRARYTIARGLLKQPYKQESTFAHAPTPTAGAERGTAFRNARSAGPRDSRGHL